MKSREWFALRTMRVFSPLPLIAGLASLVQGWVAVAAVLLLMAAVMYGFGGRAPREPLG